MSVSCHFKYIVVLNFFEEKDAYKYLKNIKQGLTLIKKLNPVIFKLTCFYG
jgi:hypothetical protein